MAGYSNKPLVDKLGIKSGANVAIIKAPPNYDELIGEWPVGVSVTRTLEGEHDFIHYFVRNTSTLAAVFSNLKQQLRKTGMLWISWPKVGGGVVTDLNENEVRRLGLKTGLVDVKVAAIDETWSGLKFVYRVVDR